jgi:Ca2+-binding RTX toxin-like protein
LDHRVAGQPANRVRHADDITGDNADNRLQGLDDDDDLAGGDGNDRLEGGAGLDDLRGNAGLDLLQGGAGNDLLDGGSGDDALQGGGENDSMFGEEGNDLLKGGGGADNLFGEDGNDFLNGGLGNDTLDGGPGDDRLFFENQPSFSGFDSVNGFQRVAGAGGDRIELQDVATGAWTAAEAGGNTVFSLRDNTSPSTVYAQVTVVGVTGMVQGDDWIIV